LIVLYIAQKVGLFVPDYIICDYKCNVFENNIIKSIGGEAFDNFDGKNVVQMIKKKTVASRSMKHAFLVFQ
jgi:hypothetical protein